MTILRQPGIDFSEVGNSTMSAFMKKLPVIGFMGLTAAPSVTNDEDEFPVDNLVNSLTYLRWATFDVVSDCSIDVSDLDNTIGINYVGFAVHNFVGMTITVYGIPAASPNDPVTLFTGQEIPNNDPLILEFQSTTLYTQIRVKISGNTAFQESRTAAIMHVGRLLRMSRGVKPDSDNPGVSRNNKIDALQGLSESGQYLGRLVRNEIKESKYEFNGIPDSDMQSSFWLPYFIDQFANFSPFLIAWAPDDYAHDVGFVWTTDPVSPVQNPITRRWSLTLNVRGYAAPSY